MKRFDWTLLLVLTVCAFPQAQAQTTEYPTEVMSCAAQEMRLFFHYLKPDDQVSSEENELACAGKRTTVHAPDWLKASLPAMAGHMVWRDPEAGELSETQLWQAPASILYEFLDLARQAFPAGVSAATAPPFSQEKEYNELLYRFRMALDRVHRSKPGNSMAGRGAGLLSAFDRAVEPLDAVADALPAGDADAFRRAADTAARDARDAFALLFTAPVTDATTVPTYIPKPRLIAAYRGFSLPLPAHQLAFLKKGQRVDVLVTFEAVMKGGNKEKVTATILQNVLVLDVLKPEKPDGRGVLELMLNPNEAQYAALSVLQGDVRVTVRAEGDVEMHPMEMASFKKLFK